MFSTPKYSVSLNEEELKISYKLKDDFEISVKPQQAKAMEVCRKWTGSPCETAEQILPMLQKYAELRAIQKHYYYVKSPNKYEEDCNTIDAYRTSGINYWIKSQRHPKEFSVTAYSSTEDVRHFLTFHWAIYMTNNICAEVKGNEGKEPYTYTHVMKHFKSIGRINTSDAVNILKYRNIVSDNFDKIQKKSMSRPR